MADLCLKKEEEVTSIFYRKLCSLERSKTQAKIAEVHGLSAENRELRQIGLQAFARVLERIPKVGVIWGSKIARSPAAKAVPSIIMSKASDTNQIWPWHNQYNNSWNSCGNAGSDGVCLSPRKRF